MTRPGAGLPSCWSSKSSSYSSMRFSHSCGSKFGEKSLFPSQGCFFCLALQSAVSFTSGNLSIKQQLSINPVSTLEVMTHNWSLTTLNLDGLSILMGNCPCTTFSFSAQPAAIPRRFCCMHWVLISILQNTGSEIIAVLLSPLIQPSLPISAASAWCRSESTQF